VAEVLKAEPVDAVFTTSPPFSCHLAGAQAKSKFGLPWIADVRDIWDCDIFRRRLENQTLAQADVLLAVSDASADILSKRFPSKRVVTVTNGFDPDDFALKEQRLTQRFSITHTGQLYEGKRDPSLLLQTLAELVAEGRMLLSDLQLRFYGPSERFLSALANQYGLETVTEVHDSVPREEVLPHQRESQLLLLLCWSNTRDSACFTIPAKLFEYMGSRRSVLSLGIERGGVSEILQRTGSGRHVASKGELREFLLASYSEFKATGRVAYRGDEVAIGKYTQLEMARKVGTVLTSIARGVLRADR
jgi:glycosyltransferase involved in cell wall biosynthesis